jgi:ornithine cyclodeaminase/alanine dehydrogenase
MMTKEAILTARSQYLNKLDIGCEVLYLSEQDCRDSGVSPQEIIAATEQSMVAYSLGQTEMPAKIGIHPQPDSLMHAMPAFLREADACGIKWISVFPTNKARFPGTAVTNSQIIYNDAATGMPLAIMDGTWITAMRTPATVLVALKYSAGPAVKTYGMLGCGVQGTANVRMAGAVLEQLERIYIFDIFGEAMDRLIASCQADIRAPIVKCRSYEELAAQSEVIVSALPMRRPPDPPVRDEWIRKGQTLVCLDCHSTFADAICKRADKYFLDSRVQHELLAGYGYYPFGLPPVSGETGEMAAGIVRGREREDELIVVNNIGMAVEDILCARLVFERALQRGIGLKLPLWGSTKGLLDK